MFLTSVSFTGVKFKLSRYELNNFVPEFFILFPKVAHKFVK